MIYFLASIVITFKTNNISYLSLIFIVISLIPENKSFNFEDGVKVSIIQPSSDPFLKYESNYSYKIEENLKRLISKISNDSKLIILPEAELPYPIESPRFETFINNIDAKDQMLLGAWTYKGNKLYNSIYSPKHDESYKKSHLVPFG